MVLPWRKQTLSTGKKYFSRHGSDVKEIRETNETKTPPTPYSSPILFDNCPEWGFPGPRCLL